MGDFFHGWRQRIGCVTLVMALAVTGDWIRSLTVQESLVWSVDKRQVQFVCLHDSFLIATLDDSQLSKETSLFPKWITREPFPIDEFEIEEGSIWKSEWCGFRYGCENGSGQTIRAWTVPYWSLVMMLTLLSAYLLLSKSRPKKSVKSP
jgi:hypothetical protein